ncbi:phage tail protein [Bifidobacterium sp. 82T10]|uniref:Phage tail protein n=1 Tax=Bifidobacterium miconis TaxID=2834435 RepID=A0ABS6WF19_9BIFI|nr:phage tail spike protein [Bifidobacterium miconis]MBW3092639.1 phage tail protein [Bifidobacterium miconis]
MRLSQYSRWDAYLGEIIPIGTVTRTRNIDGTDKIEFITDQDVEKGDRLVFADSMNRIREYEVDTTDANRTNGTPATTVTAVDAVNELATTLIEDKRNRDTTAGGCLAKALENTRWTIGTVQAGTTTQRADLAFYHISVLEALQNICDTYGLELETSYTANQTGDGIGARTISLLERRGTPDTGKRFTYGKDLTGIRRTVNTERPITRLYAYGKGVESTDDDGNSTGGYSRKITFADINNGKPYIDDNTMLATWGLPDGQGGRRHSEGQYDNGDCEDPKQLLAEAKTYLKEHNHPSVSYEADVISLGQAGYDAEGTDIGDGVQIIDTTFPTPLRLEGRILEIEEHLGGGNAETTITLGNIVQTLTGRQDTQRQQLDKLINSSGAWNSAAAGSGPYIGDLINRVNEIMNATGGYTYLVPGQGIYVYDKPRDQQPTQCIQIGGGYWRIADSRKANGDWNFRSLANGKGIFADTLFTGRLADAAGLNYIDLDTGEVSLAARALVGGKTVQQYADQTLSDANSYAETKASDALAAAKAQSKSDSDAAKAAAQAYVDALDESLGQRSIFDRLTNNGATQGIYLQGGLLYLNATYMKTGVLDAALVKTGRLTDKKGLNYIDLDTGEISLSSQTSIGEDTTLGDLSTKSYAQQLKQEAQQWAQEQAQAGDKTTLDSAKADATAKANTAEANANKHSDANDAATLASSKAYADNGDTAVLAASKAFATDQSKSQVDSFEKELTQTYIFNKLTNNGQAQGIALSAGLLYINATYIDTGILRGGNSYWNLDTGYVYVRDGRIQIDGSLGSMNVSTIIDSNGFQISTSTGVVAGLMLDSNGRVALRANTVGPDDRNYITMSGSTALSLYSSGSELFSIAGSSSSSTGYMRLQANGTTFLKTGTTRSSTANSTMLTDTGGVGSSLNYVMVSPTVSILSHDSGGLTFSDGGWGYIYGAQLQTSGSDVEIVNGNRANLTLEGNTAHIRSTSSGEVRMDMNQSYAALIAGSYNIMVHKTSGVSQTSKAAAASLASTAVLESRMIALASDGVDLDDASSYDTVPAGIEELSVDQLHDVLRLLADGDTAEAKTLLDQYESAQRVWTQRDYDLLDAGVAQ